MIFPNALNQLKMNEPIRRVSWPDGQWLCLVKDWTGNFSVDVPSNWLTIPFIAIKLPDDYFVPWNPLHLDLIAADWVAIQGELKSDNAGEDVSA